MHIQCDKFIIFFSEWDFLFVVTSSLDAEEKAQLFGNIFGNLDIVRKKQHMVYSEKCEEFSSTIIFHCQLMRERYWGLRGQSSEVQEQAGGRLYYFGIPKWMKPTLQENMCNLADKWMLVGPQFKVLQCKSGSFFESSRNPIPHFCGSKKPSLEDFLVGLVAEPPGERIISPWDSSCDPVNCEL